MMRLIKNSNFKNIRFMLLLVLTGICYIFRSDLLSWGRSFTHNFLTYYGESMGFEASPTKEMQGDDWYAENEPQSGENLAETESIVGDILQNSEQDIVQNNVTNDISWRFITEKEDYFDDALFIGDSRTVGLSEYSGLSNTTFYCSTGLSVYKIFSAQIIPDEASKKKITIEEALTKNKFSKIYLMLGINEMGTGDVDSFIEKYGDVVSRLQELQPDAIIYLESIMKVSGERSAKGDYINNEGIDERNIEIEKLADEKTIFYLDVNSAVCDSNGDLDASFTFDGVHLKASYISLWKQYLLEHVVEISSNQ